jgi:hypothetical protein
MLPDTKVKLFGTQVRRGKNPTPVVAYTLRNTEETVKRFMLCLAASALAGLAVAQTAPPTLPTEPGMYVATANGHIKILGMPVTFERTGSRLVSGLTLHIKAAHNNIQLPGRHAQTVTGPAPVFAFIPSQREAENGVTAGDLVLIKLETHGDRRQIEIAAGGAARGSSGISMTHQVAAVRSEPASGKCEIRPGSPLKPGEYALYLQRGEGLPPMLYDFSVQEEAR